MAGKADNKADVSLDSTLNASDLSVEITTDGVGSSENSEETGMVGSVLCIMR